MPGIRVRKVPKTVQEKQLKIHFSKPSNGGGNIHKIYFPLINHDAVIMFSDQGVVDHVIKKPHQLHDQEVEVECLPEHMIFTSTEAKLDTNASVLLQISRSIRDEMQFDKEITITEDTDQTLRLRGNWFQLEWAWHYIDCVMQQQEIIQSDIRQPGTEPMEIEEDSLRCPATPKRRSHSPTDVNPALRHSIAERSAVERSARSSQSSEHSIDHQGVDKMRNVHTGGATGSPRKAKSTAELLDQRLQQASYPDIIGGPGSMDHLKKNIDNSYDNIPKYAWQSDEDITGESRHHHRSMDRRAPSDGESSGDDLGLKGYAHKVPFESVHSTLGMENRERRANDENLVFENFSGLLSMQMEHERSNKTESKTYDIVAERVSKSEQDRSHSPSTSLKLTLDDDYSFRVSAALEDSVNSRLSKSPKDRSHSSAASSVRDDTGSQHAKVSSSRDNAATASSPRLGTSRSIRSPAARSPHDSWETNVGTPKVVSQEAWGDGQRYSSLPADRAGLYARSDIHMQDNYTDDQMSCTFDIAGVKVIVCKGDLTKEVTEAIVNAANQDLDHYGGVAGALSRARGPEMQAESRAHIRKNGSLKVTDVMHTSGGGEIKATHIMHAAGPMWFEYRKEECICQMAQTFLNCFNYANTKLWVKSIALPAISTGVYGAPLDECVRCFLLAVLMFVNGSQRSSLRLREIRLVNNDPEATVTSIVLLQTLMVEGIETLTRQAEELFQADDEKESRLNLPKGRPERSGSFSTTYSVTKEPVIQETNTTRSQASARRSSSLSRVPDKQKYEKDVYGSRQEERVSSERSSPYSGKSSPYDHKSGSMSDRGRERTRTSSMTSATKSSIDRDARGATGLSRTSSTSSVTSASTSNRDRDAIGETGRSRTSSVTSPVTSSRDRDTRGAKGISTDSYRTSSKPTPSSSRSNTSTTAPSMKKSLLPSDKLKSFHVKSGSGSSPLSKTTTSRMRTSDEKSSAASPTSARDPYEGSTRSEKPRARYRLYRDDDDDEEVGLRSLPVDLGRESSYYREKFLNLSQSEDKPKKKADICAICLDVCKHSKQLPKCKHTFCTDCIRKHFKNKPTCPVCNMVYGEIRGDQPKNGTMTYTIKRDTLLPGYEREDGTIVITYYFPGGLQEDTHPSPGKSYKGLNRKAYLPNSVEGREVLRMLKKAFDQRLVFTIGQSRTTGTYGMLTWNDLHHKTSMTGGPTKFGYPDPGYMTRIKDELAAKGITSDR